MKKYKIQDLTLFSHDEPSINIDHIFYNEHVKRLEARVLDEAGTGSDHLPVMMRFAL